jgi:hypothetical protein
MYWTDFANSSYLKIWTGHPILTTVVGDGDIYVNRATIPGRGSLVMNGGFHVIGE